MRVLRMLGGFALLGAGIAMLALPGPGWLSIVAGLTMLAADFPWARHLLDRVRETANRIRSRKRQVR